MTAKDVKFGADVRERMLCGVDILVNAVNVTLGPRAAMSARKSPTERPELPKHGVTVAKEIELADKFANIGAQMVKEVASRTSDLAGDGTTTVTVLAQAIARESAKAAGMNPMDLKRGIDMAVKAVDIRKMAFPAVDSSALWDSHDGYDGSRYCPRTTVTFLVNADMTGYRAMPRQNSRSSRTGSSLDSGWPCDDERLG